MYWTHWFAADTRLILVVGNSSKTSKFIPDNHLRRFIRIVSPPPSDAYRNVCLHRAACKNQTVHSYIQYNRSFIIDKPVHRQKPVTVMSLIVLSGAKSEMVDYAGINGGGLKLTRSGRCWNPWNADRWCGDAFSIIVVTLVGKRRMCCYQ